MRNAFCFQIALGLLPLLCAAHASAQAAAPETAPPLFPGGGLISYNSVFVTRAGTGTSGSISQTARPTFSHEGTFNFTWGFHPDLDVTVLVPIVSHEFNAGGISTTTKTGVGDAMLLVKYRFFRRDSPRGTTQASFSIGPKLPTGSTDFSAANGTRLPAGLQAGSGSLDLFVAANWTYTGLFNLRRLVADEDFHSLLRSQGTQAMRLGSEVDSRFWLSYRPYEAKDGSREWFIGPALTWQHFQDDKIAGVTQTGSGGNVLLSGITTYFGVRPGMHLWLAADWDSAHSAGGSFMPVRHRISFGITQQFRVRR